jgi:hypothetical protein
LQKSQLLRSFLKAAEKLAKSRLFCSFLKRCRKACGIGPLSTQNNAAILKAAEKPAFTKLFKSCRKAS